MRHDGDNLSDHDPIILYLTINWNSIALTKRQATARVAWTKARECNITEYKLALQERLNSVLPPSESLICYNIKCCNREHIAQLDTYSSQLNHACLASAVITIPSSFQSQSKTKVLPGWNEYVLPAREKSIFWHNMWL